MLILNKLDAFKIVDIISKCDEVVCCRYCKNKKKEEDFCKFLKRDVEKDDYCSWGVKK